MNKKELSAFIGSILDTVYSAGYRGQDGYGKLQHIDAIMDAVDVYKGCVNISGCAFSTGENAHKSRVDAVSTTHLRTGLQRGQAETQ